MLGVLFMVMYSLLHTYNIQKNTHVLYMQMLISDLKKSSNCCVTQWTKNGSVYENIPACPALPMTCLSPLNFYFIDEPTTHCERDL